MNDIGGVPPMAVNAQRVFFHDCAHLVESCRLVMMRRLVEVRVTAEQQREQEQLDRISLRPAPHRGCDAGLAENGGITGAGAGFSWNYASCRLSVTDSAGLMFRGTPSAYFFQSSAPCLMA